MADNGSEPQITPVPFANRIKRQRPQVGLFAFLAVTCLLGATLGIVARQWLQERAVRRAEAADLAAFQGRWRITSPNLGEDRPILVITGHDFLMITRGYGTIHIDAARSPRTVDFDWRPFGVGPTSKMVCRYSFDGDRLILQHIGGTRDDGSYAESDTVLSEIVALREPSDGT